MLDGGHVYEKPARHRDVRRNSRALSSDWLLRDLDQDLLTFTQQLGYGRLRSAISSVSPATSVLAVTPATIIPTIVCRASAPTVTSAAFILNFLLVDGLCGSLLLSYFVVGFSFDLYRCDDVGAPFFNNSVLT